MWDKYKKIIIFIASILLFFIAVQAINTYIDNKISQKTLEAKESFAKEKAELSKELEAEKINQKAKYEKQIIELEVQLEKAKILLDKIQKQKIYSTMVKKDVQTFIEEVNSLFDLKGKKDEKK